jgi:hypothetical protein
VAPAEIAVLLLVNTTDVPRTCFGSRGAHPSPVVSLVLSWENGFVPFEAVQGQNFTGGAARRTTNPIQFGLGSALSNYFF